MATGRYRRPKATIIRESHHLSSHWILLIICDCADKISVFQMGRNPRNHRIQTGFFCRLRMLLLTQISGTPSASRPTLRPNQDTKSPVGLESRLKYQFGFNAYRQPGEWHSPCILPLRQKRAVEPIEQEPAPAPCMSNCSMFRCGTGTNIPRDCSE